MSRGFDIIVVGSGLVGATFAARLAGSPVGRNLNLAVIDRQLRASRGEERFDPRVVALTEASRSLLADAGIWTPDVVIRSCPYFHMEVRDGMGTGLIEFDCADVHQPDLGHIVENSAIVNSAHARLSELENVSVIEAGVADIAFREHDVQLELDSGDVLAAPLLVAADGANSLVREKAGFSTRSWEYDHTAIVTTIETTEPHGQTAFQWFGESGPLAFLPLTDGEGDLHHCSIVWSQTPDANQALMALTDDEFCQALTRASEARLGAVIATAKRFQFPLRQRHATDYIKPCVALAGDAAHTIHPLAGQGVNLGFGDVVALAEEIERGVERGLKIGDFSTLNRYQRRRKPDNLAMMAAMEGFKRLFASDNPLLRIARNQGMSTLNHLAPVKSQLVRRAMGF